MTERQVYQLNLDRDELQLINFCMTLAMTVLHKKPRDSTQVEQSIRQWLAIHGSEKGSAILEQTITLVTATSPDVKVVDLE
jgi:hypothetical protein